jgi:hypothetical protein
VQPPAIRSMGLPMDYSSIFEEAITALHAERRYRFFVDLERIAGRFTYALWRCAGETREIVGSLSGAPITISAWARIRPLFRLLPKRRGRWASAPGAPVIAAAAGHSGSGAEYLRETVTRLEALGIRDRNLWRLQALVAARIGGRG